MHKKYYIMALNEEAECPTGFYYSVLARDLEGVSGDYGRNPWYAGPKRYGGRLPPLPDELMLMEKKNYRYDVRSGSQYFYVISSKFKECLSSLKHGFSEIKKIDCIDELGRKRADRDVLVAVSNNFMQKNCLDLTKSRHSSRTKIELEIIHFKEDWDFDVFAIQDISSSQASLFCSGEAKKIFEDSGIRCVKYIPLSDINASMLPHMNELYRPVGFYDPV